jgi:3-oxoacyl-[acyl-carrier protein] reductase
VSGTIQPRLRGRVALVTGGGWNIGRATAERLAAEGAAVVVTSRSPERLEATVAAIRARGGRALAVAGDVTVLADVERAVAAAEAEFGHVDCLAAIAGGGGGYEAVDAIDPTLWAQVVQLNLVGTFHAVRAVLPGMRSRNRGTIVTCSGGGAWFPMVGHNLTAYATAKAGICRFTDQLAVELFGTGIRVNCLQPGQVWSEDRLRAVAAEELRTGALDPGREYNHPPEHAAELAAFLLADASAPLTGRIAAVDEDWWRDPRQVQAVAQSLHAYCLRRVTL